MKIIKIFITILIFSLIYCEDRRKLFAENIKDFALSFKEPQNTKELIESFDISKSIFCNTVTLKELAEIQVKFDLSDDIITQIKTAPYSRNSAVKRIKEIKLSLYKFGVEMTIGGAIKEDNGKISFALIKTRSLANLETRFDYYYKRECQKVWIVFKKCKDILASKVKDLTPEEIILIKEAANYTAANSLLKGAEILSKDDYELYMSDTSSIYSPDKKSVMHITYFGDIAIGPTEELNSILPLNRVIYESRNDYIIYNEYPKTEKITINEKDRLVLNNGFFHEFNFILNDNIPKFPRQFDNYMRENSKRGPFVLELKKNGNIIFYEEKTNKIIWTTNTANKGTGPYNFYLSNDRELILKDSNNNIIYSFDTYRKFGNTLPTIYYSIKNKQPVYNGRILDFGIYDPVHLNIKTDNEMFNIIFEIKDKDTKIWHEFNGEYFDPKLDKDPYYFSGFSASLIIKDEYFGKFNSYSICYTLRSYDIYWTPIACDGERIEMGNIETSVDHFTQIIIYVTANPSEVPPIMGVTYSDYLDKINK